MLYWDENVTESVKEVVEIWRSVCPNWNVTLFTKCTAYQFLLEKFGTEVSNLFLSCSIPAMRSDFFRIHWAMSEGGIYTDMTFIPTQEPMFFDKSKPMTCFRFWHGRIVNGIFFANKDSPELHMIAKEVSIGVSQRIGTNLWLITGPGAWIRAVGQRETNTMTILNSTPSDIVQYGIRHRKYQSSTRDSEHHWSQKQKHKSIFATDKEIRKESLLCSSKLSSHSS